MSFKKCINGHVGKGLTQAQADRLNDAYERKVKEYQDKGLGSAAAKQAAEDIMNAQASLMMKKHRNIKNHALKQEFFDEMFKTKLKGKSDAKVRHVLQAAHNRGQGVFKTFMRQLNDFGKDLSGGLFEITRGEGHKIFRDAILELGGQATDNVKAQKLAEVIRKLNKYIHARHKNAGGIMGNIKDYDMPHIHSGDALRAKYNERVKVLKKKGLDTKKAQEQAITESKEEWIKSLMTEGVLAREKMIDPNTGTKYTDADLRERLDFIYDDIMSNGGKSAEARFQKGMSPFHRTGDIDVRHNSSRMLQFASGEKFLEYNNNFGVGDKGLINSYLSYLQSMAQDIGMLEYLGPKPDAMMRHFDNLMAVDQKKGLVGDWGRRLANSNYRLLRGVSKGNPNSMGWKVANGYMNLLRSAYLGAASISAISDTAFLIATARMRNLNTFNALKMYGQLVAPGSKGLKGIANRAGFISDVLNGNMISDTRFAGEMWGDGKGITSWLANMTNKLSGLHRMTEAVKDAISLEGMSTLADRLDRKVSWEKLDPELKASLEDFQFTKAEWEDMQKLDLYDTGKGVKFLMSSEMRVSNKIDSKRALQLANKLDDWVEDLRRMAANEPSLSTRSLGTGEIAFSGGSRTAIGVGARATFMFKSFPVTVVMNHLIPPIRNLIEKRGDRLKQFEHLSTTIIGSMLLGAVAIQAKDAIRNKTPQSMDNWKFWAAALTQGGGLGLLGDLFIKDYTRYGHQSVLEVLGGPVWQNADQMVNVLQGEAMAAFDTDEDKSVGRAAYRYLKRQIPLGSLWYFRFLIESALDTGFNNLIDDSYLESKQRLKDTYMEKTGQKDLYQTLMGE
jgi:hypothetical protein